MIVSEDKAAQVQPVELPDELFAAVYATAMKTAEAWGRRNPTLRDELIDAATSAVLWARDHCTAAPTFPAFAGRAVRTWIGRELWRCKRKARNRPQHVELDDDMVHRARVAKPVRPLLIEDLPEDLAFVVRLFFVDAYTVREIGLLTGKGHNTVDLMLKKAAALLAPGRVKPERRKGEKCLTAG